MNRFFTAFLFALALALTPALALADKIAILSFTPSPQSATTSQQLDEARAATRAAITQRAHTQPSESELLTAQMSTRDGVADTRSEYRSAGRASGSAWTIAGHVDARGGDTYRLEVEVCQVESGRVESLVREIAPSVAAAQIGEMVDYLVRPEGIGTSDITWKVNAPAAPPKTPGATTVVTSTTPSAPEPPAVRHAFAEGAPLAVGLGVDALAAISRPVNARGSGATFGLHGAVTYALPQVPGLDLRGDLGFVVAGPEALHATVGARYMFPLVPTVRAFIGPEVGLGGFFTVGAEKTARFLAHGAAVAAVGIGPRAQIEVAGAIDYAGGGSGSLVLGGASLRGLVRF